MIQTLDRCSSGPKRAAMIQAIQNWKQKISGAGTQRQESR